MRSLVRIGVAISVIAAAVVTAVVGRPDRATPPSTASADAPAGATRGGSPTSAFGAAGARNGTVVGPRVGTAVAFDVSPPLRSIASAGTTTPPALDDENEPPGPVGDTRHDPDPVVQDQAGSGVFSREIPPTGVSFDGMSNPDACNGCSPPDPNGDIGPNHYVQMVNVKFQIFSRSGTSLLGPANINTIWTGFPGLCAVENAGDPIVLHDQMADRWLLSQFTANGPIYYNCVAISTTADPTGTYYRYAFSTGLNFPDYPKYGVWPDAYYISTREFLGPATFAGVGAYALNRAQMLAGNPSPQVVSFVLAPGSEPYRTGDGLLPSDLDGDRLPAAGSPNYFVGSMDSGGPYGAPIDALNLFKFDVDFANPGSSTFTFANQIPIAAYDTIFPCSPSRACIPQPGTTEKIDILSYRQRPIWRLAYRNFGTHESLVTNQSVEATAGIAGTRWWEIRSPNSSPSIFQEGTYAPADGVHRWMGSIAMDGSGNMGLGYSVSDGTSVFPGVRYTGRLAGDAPGTMPQGEGTIVAGGGSQTSTGRRWGDYSSMNVDPVDDCTFWYTNEYYATTSAANWKTRIGSFKFPTCLKPTAVKVLRLTARWNGRRVGVSWRTASEATALGYNLYRSAGSGPFRKMNRALIVAKHSAGARGAAYRFVDRAVRRGTAYQYRLQIVDAKGKRSWYGVGSAAAR